MVRYTLVEYFNINNIDYWEGDGASFASFLKGFHNEYYVRKNHSKINLYDEKMLNRFVPVFLNLRGLRRDSLYYKKVMRIWQDNNRNRHQNNYYNYYLS